jgi:uncharacterized protein (TIGR02118 family)
MLGVRDGAPSMTVLRVCYKHGVRFDEAYYVSKHLPLAGGIMQPYGVRSVEVVKVAGGIDGSTPPYQMIFSAYFETMDGLQQALKSPRMAEIIGDVPNYFAGTPDIMIGDVIVSLTIGGAP